MWGQLLAHRPRNQLRSLYYDGKHILPRVGNIIPSQYYNLGLVLGWSAKTVDMLALRCAIDEYKWADGELDTLGFPSLNPQGALLEVFNQARISSLIHGVSFLLTTEGEKGEPDVMVHAKDALNCTGLWNSRTRTLTQALSIHEWGERGRRPVSFSIYRDGQTINVARPLEGGEYVIESDPTHNLGVPVEPLVYKRRSGRDFGSSRISRPVMSAQDAGARTLVRMEGHADVYSIPQMILLGGDESAFTEADGSMKPAWKIALGRVLAIADDPESPTPRAEVQQFNAASPQPHIDNLRVHAELLCGESSIPVSSLGLGLSQANPVSADAYLASREDLVSTAENAMSGWDPPQTRTVLRALQAKNGEKAIPEEWLTISSKVRSAMYTSRAQAADAGTKIVAAVPGMAETEVGLELMGLSPDQIKRFLAERRRVVGSEVLNALRARGAATTVPEVPPAPAPPVPEVPPVPASEA